MYVLGRDDGGDDAEDDAGRDDREPGPDRNRFTGRFGRFRARDGSDGAAVGIDLDHPHAGLVVGKRGSGKSHTLGVVAEAAARAPGVAPVVVDPMDVFAGLTESADGPPVPAHRVPHPRVRADALPPAAWPSLLGLDASDSVGALVWQVAAEASTLTGMRERAAAADADPAVRRAARNHLRLAAAWEVFDPDGLDATALGGPEATVLSLAGLDPAPANAVVAVLARAVYEARLAGTVDRLPWLLLDEAHAFFDGVAADALGTVLTRGRRPGVSLVAATQRPAALPPVAVSQADLLVAHRLTARADVAALAGAAPTYLDGTLGDRLPRGTGEALVVDDSAEAAHVVRVRGRHTPHGGASPRASRHAERARRDAHAGSGSGPV